MTARKCSYSCPNMPFSITIMLTELFIVLSTFYSGQMAPIVWIILVILVSLATIVSIVNRSMNPESKVNIIVSVLFQLFGPLALICLESVVYLKK